VSGADVKDPKDATPPTQPRPDEVDVRDLERRGLEKVRVLRERDLDRMIRTAVDAALVEDGRDREQLLARSRKKIEETEAEAQEQQALNGRGEAVAAELARAGNALDAELAEVRADLARAEAELEARRRANEEAAARAQALRERAGPVEARAGESLAALTALSVALAELRGRLDAAQARLPEEGEPAVKARLEAAERRGAAAERSIASLEKRIARIRQAAAARRPEHLEPGRGLDVGTANLVAAVQGRDGPVHTALQRNAFIEVGQDAIMRSMLTAQGVPYAEIDGRTLVVGDAAFELARILNKELRRPMASGIVSPREADALPIMKLVIERLLGPPGRPGEICCFSVPAEAVDTDANAIYHEGVFKELIGRLGYEPRPIKEGHAVILSDLADDDFTGVGISCGGGMHNVCVAYKAVNVLSFSTARGGDWIDQNVATVLGVSRARATALKEGGIDIRAPRSREEEAVSIYTRELIRHTLGLIARRFESTADRPGFPDPVDVVFAGGTSLVGGFIEVAREELLRVSFPIPVKRVRLAEDPLHAVAKGCLVMALAGTDA